MLEQKREDEITEPIEARGLKIRAILWEIARGILVSILVLTLLAWGVEFVVKTWLSVGKDLGWF